MVVDKPRSLGNEITVLQEKKKSLSESKTILAIEYNIDSQWKSRFKRVNLLSAFRERMIGGRNIDKGIVSVEFE